jgi:uncharacterized protein (TIGR03067 family)
LQGEWTAKEIIANGEGLPAFMLRTARRRAEKNEIVISFGGRTMIHALVKIDETQRPIAIDYLHLDGATKGTRQHGIFQWEEKVACFCMSAPGQPRPGEFTSPPGSGRTLSRWQRGK